MPSDTQLQWHQIDSEMKNAEKARIEGFEGKARVCARRAVSQALFLTGFASNRSINAIQSFIESPNIPEEIRQMANPFLEKVNETHQLESGTDLLENSRRIIVFLKDTKGYFLFKEGIN
jgi:hypothetical protein